MIRVQHLTKRFGALTAVDDISFEIDAGEILAFLGPNGAGKTTTIKMLTTILSPTTGTIELNGLNLVERKSEARRHFGVVFQDPTLDQDLTAWESMDLHGVLYGMKRKQSNERSEMLLKAFELWERKDSQVRPFSGGMKRRLEVARGLMHAPKILFLDEPTLGLDPQSRNLLWTHVGEINRTEGITIFLTTHYLDEAERVASRIAVIDHGRIIALGSPQEIKAQTGTTSLNEAFLSLTGTAVRDETSEKLEDRRSGARVGGR